MTGDEITLGFRAFDVHELLLHFIALKLGYYDNAGLRVSLRDLTFVTDYREHALSVACGSALVARAQGIAQKVVFIGTDYPMFWVYGKIPAKASPESIAVGAKPRIATFPPLSPPWYLLPLVLRGRGIDPQAIDLLPVRDDVGRLGLLRSGNVDAAVISSAFPPPKMQQFGFAPCVFFGSQLRLPTTGLTASEEMIRTRPDVVQRFVSALLRSLSAVRGRENDVVSVVGDVLGEGENLARQTYDLIAPYFSGDGRGDASSRRSALEFANAEFGQHLKEEDVYEFAFLS